MFLPANITLQFGDSGDFVAELQRRLAAVDAHAKDGINGVYDGVTVNSVSSFQSRVGIRADGIAGPETLRRLNGVMSGDSSAWGSGGSSSSEEAEKARNDMLAQQLLVGEIVPPVPGYNAAWEQGEAVTPAATAHVETPTIHHPQHHAPEPASVPILSSVQHAQEQLAQQQQHHGLTQDRHELLPQQHAPQHQQPQHQPAPQPQTPNAETLVQMLLQQTSGAVPAPQPVAPVPPPMPQQHAPAPQAQPGIGEMLLQQLKQQTQHAPAQTAPTAPVPPAATHQQPAAAQPKPPELAATQAEEQQSSRGLIGRAMQKMSDAYQRLAQHFEARLPPDVLREVERIGQTMAQNGIREASIPTGPEAARGQTPARGPEQQQVTGRG